MLHISQSLVQSKLELLEALKNLLHANHIPNDMWQAFPASEPFSERAPFTLKYDCKPKIANDLDVLVQWPMKSETGEIYVGLHAGIRMMAMLLTEGWAEKLSEVSHGAKPRDALTLLNLPYLQYFRNAVDDAPDQSYICPVNEGFGHIYADQRPPAHIESWSEKAASVAAHLAVSLKEYDADIATKLANHLPE